MCSLAAVVLVVSDGVQHCHLGGAVAKLQFGGQCMHSPDHPVCRGATGFHSYEVKDGKYMFYAERVIKYRFDYSMQQGICWTVPDQKYTRRASSFCDSTGQ